MSSPNLNKPVFKLFPNLADRVKNKKCPTCNKDIKESDFKNEISVREYGISGMCQVCQDNVFGMEMN